MKPWSRPTIPPRQRDDKTIRDTNAMLAALAARIDSHGGDGLPAWLLSQGINRRSFTDKVAALGMIRGKVDRAVLDACRDVLP